MVNRAKEIKEITIRALTTVNVFVSAGEDNEVSMRIVKGELYSFPSKDARKILAMDVETVEEGGKKYKGKAAEEVKP